MDWDSTGKGGGGVLSHWWDGGFRGIEEVRYGTVCVLRGMICNKSWSLKERPRVDDWVVMRYASISDELGR